MEFLQQKFDFRCSVHPTANGLINPASVICADCCLPRIISTMSGARLMYFCSGQPMHFYSGVDTLIHSPNGKFEVTMIDRVLCDRA